MSLIFVISNIDNNNGGVSRRVIGLLLQLLMRVLNVFLVDWIYMYFSPFCTRETTFVSSD